MNDVTDALESLLSEGNFGFTRRLSFHERCGLFYITQMSFRRNDVRTALTGDPVDDKIRAYSHRGRLTQAAIAKAFGVSQAAVSHVANALVPSRDGRLSRVGREWMRLGPQAFGETYFTEDMRLAIARARSEHLPSGPSPASNAHAGFHPIGGRQFIFVYWAEADADNKKGWTYRTARLGAEPDRLIGEKNDHVRERTSRAALVYAWRLHCGLDHPETAAPPNFPPALSREDVITQLTENNANPT